MRKFAMVVIFTFLLYPLHASEMDVDQIIDKFANAVGGKENIAKVNAIVMTGKLKQGEVEYPVKITTKRPNKFRVEFSVQGKVGIQAFDGSTGWFYMPFLGDDAKPEKVPPHQVAVMKEQDFFYDGLVNYKNHGNKVEFLGEDEVEGTPVYKIKLIKPSGNEIVYFIDKDSFLLLKNEVSIKLPDGNTHKSTVILGDYKKVGDLMLNFYVEEKRGKNASVIEIDEYKINPTIDDKIFAFPENVEKTAN